MAPAFVKKKKAAGKENVPSKWPPVLQSGVNIVPTLVENKTAYLIVIAHHVDPIALVVFLPVLCLKMGVSYCSFEGKARLGHPVDSKTCATITFMQVNSEYKGALVKLVEANYKGRYDEKLVAHIAKLEKAKGKELATRLG
uniref:60S ribosomal protein L7a n=1 Tax=Catagonus wagneri TaxID=51154 RepID=A0A8C3YKQ2_9CETA